MATYPVLIDSQPAYLQGGASTHTLLLTPFGRGALLNRVMAEVATVSRETPAVLATCAVDDAYVGALHAAAGRAVPLLNVAHFEELVYAHEPSDWLLLVDPSRYPQGGFRLRDVLKPPATATTARHVVVRLQGQCDAHECVHVDPTGWVRRIQRYYDGLTWQSACGVACTLVSIASLHTVGHAAPACLFEFRQELTRCGVLARDVCLPQSALDLRAELGRLQMMERDARAVTTSAALPQRRATQHIVVGRDCAIHPTARLVGHVLVQDGVRIEADARVIGPSVLGQGASVGRAASIAHCLVMPGLTIADGASVRGRVYAGAGDVRPATHAWLPVAATAVRGAAGEASEHHDTYIGIKAALDAVVALLGLIILAPLFALVAIAIRLDSRGPVFFGHAREGRGGRQFRCWKFRTMIANADALQRALYQQSAVDGPQFKIARDPRVTRLGGWLRKLNVDELPQLINVLLGQMSLIGPRPSPFRENQICVPWRQARLSVRPGITGLWQLCRHERDSGDFHQWIHYDLLYVRHLSWWLDVKIVLGTLATFGGRWSVPVQWVVPSDQLHGGAALSVAADWIPTFEPMFAVPLVGRATAECCR